MIAYGGVANITGTNGVRQVPLEEFCIGPRRTVLSGDEILIYISFQLYIYIISFKKLTLKINIILKLTDIII